MRRRTLTAATASSVLALAIGAAPAFAQGAAQAAAEEQGQQQELKVLGLGDDVPALDNSAELEWITGGTHNTWEEGHIYVLDFWATWCGPCIRAMPHIIDVQDQYAEDDVHVVGVHIWARDSAPTVPEFLDSRSSLGFNYSIVRETGDWAARTYMDATGSNGIPTIMIVNREGRLAWIGYPNDMDEPLAQIVAGEYDLDAAIEADATRRAAAERRMREQRVLTSPEGSKLFQELNAAFGSGEYRRTVDILDRLIALDEDALSRFRMNQYYILAVQLQEPDAAADIAEKMLDSPVASDPAALNGFAWSIVAPGSEYAEAGVQQADIAVRAAQLASDATDNKNADILDTLARAYFVHGDVSEAVSVQQKAVEIAAAGENPDQRMVNSFRERLNEYREALASQEG